MKKLFASVDDGRVERRERGPGIGDEFRDARKHGRLGDRRLDRGEIRHEGFTQE